MADTSGFQFCGADVQLAAKASPQGSRIELPRASNETTLDAIIGSPGNNNV